MSVTRALKKFVERILTGWSGTDLGRLVRRWPPVFSGFFLCADGLSGRSIREAESWRRELRGGAWGSPL